MTAPALNVWRCPTCDAQGTYRYAAGAAWCTACHADANPKEETHAQQP